MREERTAAMLVRSSSVFLESLESFLWVADGMIDEQLGGGGKIQCFAQGILVHGHAGDCVHA